jgi:hypothetical protein
LFNPFKYNVKNFQVFFSFFKKKLNNYEETIKKYRQSQKDAEHLKPLDTFLKLNEEVKMVNLLKQTTRSYQTSKSKSYTETIRDLIDTQMNMLQIINSHTNNKRKRNKKKTKRCHH